MFKNRTSRVRRFRLSASKKNCPSRQRLWRSGWKNLLEMRLRRLKHSLWITMLMVACRGPAEEDDLNRYGYFGRYRSARPAAYNVAPRSEPANSLGHVACARGWTICSDKLVYHDFCFATWRGSEPYLSHRLVSAGGDGVTTWRRASGRNHCAAAAMCAGHPNETTTLGRTLRNLPFFSPHGRS